MAGQVLLSGRWRPIGDALTLVETLKNRTYRRDKDGKFSRGGGGGKPAEGEDALAAAPIAMPDLDGGGARGFDTLPDAEAHALRYFRGEGYRKVTPALYLSLIHI